MIILLVAAAIVVGAPLVAAVLVTVASLREDAGKSLSGQPPSRFDAAARRLLRFQSGLPGRRPAKRIPRPRSHSQNSPTQPLTGPRA
jgi:hypothetical protein